MLGQLLDDLLNVGGSCGFATSSHPCRRNLNEMLKDIPNLMEKQLRRIKEISSAVATSPDGGTSQGDTPASLPLKYVRICWYQEEWVHRRSQLLRQNNIRAPRMMKMILEPRKSRFTT